MNFNGIAFKLSEKTELLTSYYCENKWKLKCKSKYIVFSDGNISMSPHCRACKLAGKRKNENEKLLMNSNFTKKTESVSYDSVTKVENYVENILGYAIGIRVNAINIKISWNN